MDFLTDRPQRVRVNGVMSNTVISSTGSPQGCVLSPLLFVLYTNECFSQHTGRHILKFSDDSVIVSLLSNDDPVHGPVVREFIDWCFSSFMCINVSKTKEMLIDFRKNQSVISPLVIEDQAFELVHNYKYLGTNIDDKLCFDFHVDAVCKKAHQRMYFYRKLQSFNVDSTFMKMFYSCFIESVLTFSFICWYGLLTIKNKSRLRGIVRVCSKIAGLNLNDLTELHILRTLGKARSLLSDQSHPLAGQFVLLPSGRRYILPRCRTNRLKNSFVPVAIGLLNKS